MSKLTSKIALSIVLAGIFVITAFVAVNYERLDLDYYIVILCLIVFVFSFGLAIGDRLSSPAQELLDKAIEISKGNLSSRAYLKSKDELSQLAEVFNKIAEEINDSRERETIAEKSVGIKVMAKTRDLEETISALEQKVKNRTIELEKLVTESSRLQTDAKVKESEIAQLKNELGGLKQKVVKYNKEPKVQQIKGSEVEA